MEVAVSSSLTPSSSSSGPVARPIHQLTPSQMPTALRVIYPVLLFLSIISPAQAQGRCFNLPKGLSIEGGDYRRLRSIDHRSCALECRDDPSCLAYEWKEVDEVCFLKSRSLSGDLEKKEETFIGFCLDENDEVRDRFRDHVVKGPEVARKDELDGDDCRSFCMSQETAAIYTWSPLDIEDDEANIGTCTCLESLRGMSLQFNSFSGILPPKRHPRRVKFRL